MITHSSARHEIILNLDSTIQINVVRILMFLGTLVGALSWFRRVFPALESA